MRATAIAVLIPMAVLWNEPCSDGRPVGAAGGDLFSTHCASCHGEDARGDGPRADSLATAPADLTLLGVEYGMPLPIERLSQFVDGRVATHAGREMPAFGEEFFADEPPNPNHEAARRIAIELILGHLETLQRSQNDE
jgi:hypothetical protein